MTNNGSPELASSPASTFTSTPLSIPPPLAIYIRPATSSDLDSCAAAWGWRWDTYRSIYPLRLRRDDIVTPAQRLARNRRDLEVELEAASGSSLNAIATCKRTFDVAVDENTGDVVGYTIWTLPGAMDYQDKRQRNKEKEDGGVSNSDSETNDDDDEKDPECDHELADKIKQESIQAKLKYLDGSNHWMLQQLFIPAQYQRRGVGTALLQHGLARIRNATPKDHSVTIGMTSSPQGLELYRRYGFKDVYWFRPDVKDIDESTGQLVKKDVSWPLLVRRGPL